MIRFEEVAIFNWAGALRGMRNPWESWDKADSYYESQIRQPMMKLVMGKNDLLLAMTLSKAGSDHAKFLRQIIISMDIIAPEYWWKEFDTYKVGIVANSTSMMHKLGSRELTPSDFSFDSDESPRVRAYMSLINNTRQEWVDSGKKKPSPEWREMVQLVSTAYIYRRTVTLNYAVLQSIYHSRKNHKLEEWNTFCKWIEDLPYSQIITHRGEV